MLDRQTPGHIHPAAGHLVVDLAEAGVVLHARGIVRPVAIEQLVANAGFVRHIAAGIGHRCAPFDLEIVVLAECVRAAQLVVDQLALVPLGVVVAHIETGQLIAAGAAARHLQGIVHIQSGPADGVAAVFPAQAQHAVGAHVVAGGGEVVVGIELDRIADKDAVLLLAGARAPLVVVAGHRDDAQLGLAHVHAVTGTAADIDVRGDAVLSCSTYRLASFKLRPIRRMSSREKLPRSTRRPL